MIPRTISQAVLAILIVFAATTSHANDLDSWLGGTYATGQWHGARQRWGANGIDPQASWVIDILGNPTGGKEQTIEYAGLFELDLSFDLDKLVGVGGLTFFISGSWASGANLSEAIGNVFQVGEAFSGRTVRLSQLFLVQALSEGRLEFKFGRISAGDDFAFLPVDQYFVNTAMNGNPLSIPINDPGFQQDPVAQWGALATFRPTDKFSVKIAGYNADPDVALDARHGLDFTFNPQDGILAIAEAGLAPELQIGDRNLPGHYKVGAYYDSSDFEYLDNSGSRRTSQFGLYFMIQQEIYREGAGPGLEHQLPGTRNRIRARHPSNRPGTHQGLTPWFSVALSPLEEISPMPVFLSGGLVYRGLFPNRDSDLSAFAVYIGRFSDEPPGRSAETVLEFNHRFRLGPWLHITPDLQYVVMPSGGGIPNSFVLGFETAITF